MTNANDFMGKHLIIDCYTTNKHILTTEQITKDYLKQVTKLIGMTMVYPALVEKFPFAGELDRYQEEIEAEGISGECIKKMRHHLDKRNNNESGVSGISIWLESHCAVHTWDDKNAINIDLFSCKNFEIDEILKFTAKHFDLNLYKFISLERYLFSPYAIKQGSKVIREAKAFV